jgi:pimeloyl-ACP methyl ester carboxylesterase
VREAGAGPPVILIHGLGGSSEWWRQNIAALAGAHRVFAIDLVGFGRNRFFLKRSRLPLDFADIASLIARWIDTEIVEPTTIIGNSMGGQIAIHLAAARPDIVRALVLVNSTGVPFRVAPSEHLRHLFVPRGLWSFLIVLARDAFRAGPTSIGVALGRIFRDDARPLLRRLQVPVLLVWGEHDPLVPLRYAKEMLIDIRNARLEIIEGAGHVPMWEQPRAFNDVVLQFLEEQANARSAHPSAVFTWSISGFIGGIAYRKARRGRDVILIHGLGMSSVYFRRLAKELFEKEWSPIAPDLPGFGESVDSDPNGPREHAALLAAWADLIGIEDAVWVGHSVGCNVVGSLLQIRPDLVGSAVYIGPLWRDRNPFFLFPLLVLDALREPVALIPLVVRAYWRAGLMRWVRTFFRYTKDLNHDPPPGLMIVGNRDPLVDRNLIANFINVPGAHACLFSHPRATASIVSGPKADEQPAS